MTEMRANLSETRATDRCQLHRPFLPSAGSTVERVKEPNLPGVDGPCVHSSSATLETQFSLVSISIRILRPWWFVRQIHPFRRAVFSSRSQLLSSLPSLSLFYVSLLLFAPPPPSIPAPPKLRPVTTSLSSVMSRL